MKYMMFVIADPAAEAEEAAHPSPNPPTVQQWFDEVSSNGKRLDGERLRPVSDATTVRVSRGEVIVTDGPFTESKEWIAGFDILECDDLDEAIRIASLHPQAYGGKLELRPFLAVRGVTSSGCAASVGDTLTSLAGQRVALVGRLIRLTGDWDLAEDSVQDAFEKAVARWPVDGIPEAPAAWLTTVARNRAVDVIRRGHTAQSKLREAAIVEQLTENGLSSESWADDQLRLIFTCCHPALPMAGRVALTLKTVAGLETAEIARAFLVSEATLSQRLLRTKRKILHAAIPYRVPPLELLSDRLGGVLATLYLISNEGYGRPDDRVAAEALRLTGLLVRLMPGEPEVRGLHALLLFHAARRSTRFDSSGDLVGIEDQDRSQWNSQLVANGHD